MEGEEGGEYNTPLMSCFTEGKKDMLFFRFSYLFFLLHLFILSMSCVIPFFLCWICVSGYLILFHGK